MKHLTCREVEPLLPATAAGALDQEEAGTIQAHLASCPPCVQHLHEYQETVEQLAYTVPQVAPPVALRGRVLQSATVLPPLSVASAPGWLVSNGRTAMRPRAATPPPLLALYRQVAPSVLAASLLLLLGLGIWAGTLAQQVSRMQPRVAQQQEMYDLLRQPGAEMAVFKPAPNSAAAGQVLMAPGHRQVAIMATHLPALAAGRSYQLWMLRRGTPEAVPAGMIFPDDAGSAMAVVGTPADPAEMAGLRITDEPTAGSAAPTGSSWLEAWYR